MFFAYTLLPIELSTCCLICLGIAMIFIDLYLSKLVFCLYSNLYYQDIYWRHLHKCVSLEEIMSANWFVSSILARIQGKSWHLECLDWISVGATEKKKKKQKKNLIDIHTFSCRSFIIRCIFKYPKCHYCICVHTCEFKKTTHILKASEI